MYSTDTIPGVVWVRDYDASTGEYGPRREHLQIDDGYPDGICVDADGHLWVAIWGAGEVRSFTPDGRARRHRRACPRRTRRASPSSAPASTASSSRRRHAT